jgi:hypothetical protein
MSILFGLAVIFCVSQARAADPKTAKSADQPRKSDSELDELVKNEANKYGPQGPDGKLLPPLKITAKSARSVNEVAAKIDAIIDRELEKAKVPASGPASDAEFLRRAYVDILGVIPTVEKARQFIDSTDSRKREKLIAELLGDSQYGYNFAHYWHDILIKRDPDNNRQIKAGDVFIKWLAHRLNNNRSWDDIVRSMLTAKGDQTLAGETFFILANADNGQPAPAKIVGTASALFLGNQLMCAECHIHPNTSAWKQNDFWGLAAFFGRTRMVRDNPAKKNVTNNTAHIVDVLPGKGKDVGEVVATLPDGSIGIPDPRNEGKFIGGARAKLLNGNAVSRAEVNRNFAADWFTSPENPYFARAAVNRLWSQFFGHGFINPLDDIRPSTIPSDPEALDLLAEEFIVSKFDQKHLISIICATKAYQRSSATVAGNKEDTHLFSHMGMKVLTPRSLFLSYGVATSNQVAAPIDAEPGDKPAKADNSNQGLLFFDSREYDQAPGEYSYGVPQLLRLMNSKLPPACDAVAKSVMTLRSKDKVIEHLYLTALARHPTPSEMKRMNEFIAKQPSVEKGYSAMMWALLNSAEFVNNH